MENLDLYKDRAPYTVNLEVKGGKKTFKIPTELTVEESERLLEIEMRIAAASKEEASGNKRQDKQKVDAYIGFLLEYILILLQHYQPELDMAALKKMVSRAEAIKIFEFFKRQRFLKILGLDTSDQDDGSKKKIPSPAESLDALRRSITFLVINGFSLLELRKLYIDEFLAFYDSLVYIKEQNHELKEGTYQSFKAQSSGDISSLKRQIFNINKQNGQ